MIIDLKLCRRGGRDFQEDDYGKNKNTQRLKK